MFTAVNRSIAWADAGGRARARDQAAGRGACGGSVASRGFGGPSNAEAFVSPVRPRARTPTNAAVPVPRRRDGSDGRPELVEVVA